MIHRGGFAVALIVCFVTAGVALAADRGESAAQAAAESWLALVDGGNYPASWNQAARGLKASVKQAEWSQVVGGVRTPLGRLVSRRLKSREYTEKVPTTRMVGGNLYTLAGSGRYVVIQYDAVFAHKPSAIETVISMADPDGTWRVSGYSVN
jgi:Protein of unknown function (DUF4019)